MEERRAYGSAGLYTPLTQEPRLVVVRPPCVAVRSSCFVARMGLGVVLSYRDLLVFLAGVMCIRKWRGVGWRGDGRGSWVG